MFGKRKEPEYFKSFQYNPDTMYQIIKSSICTGEKTIGFKMKHDGKYIELAAVKSPEDIAVFKKHFGLDDIKTEY